MIEKIKALAQWFVMLERSEHRHWCTCRGYDRDLCPYKGYAWMCNGIFCANSEQKNCVACEARLIARVYAKRGGDAAA